MSFWFPALLAAQTAGVLVIGRDVDPAAVVKEQAKMEARVAASGLTLVGAAELGRALAGSAAPPVMALDATAREKAAAKIDAGKGAYYEGALASALAAFDAAAAVQNQAAAIPVEDRIRTSLWRATVLLAQNDSQGAQNAAAEVVQLSPDYAVPLDTFAPPLKQLVDSIRASEKARAVPVAFEGAPETAELLLDDRALAGRKATVIPGKHWVRMRGPGLTEQAWAVSVPPNTTASEPRETVLTVRPAAVALPPEIVARLGTPEGLTLAARAANVDSLAVMLLGRDDIKARVWNGSASAAKTFGARELDIAGPWVVRQLARPSPKPAPANGVYRTSSGAITASAGPRIAFATRSISADGIDPVTVELTGTGAALDARYASGVLRAGASAWAVSFAPTQTTAVVGGVRAHAPGGMLAGGRVSGGAAFAGGLAGVSAALSFDRYQATALPIDRRVPLFVSQTRIAPEIRLHSELDRGNLALGAELGLAPVTLVTEDPGGTSGESPRGGPDVDWRLGASMPMGRTWRAAAHYDGALRRTAFTGASSVAFDPPLEDATVSESFHSLTFSVSRSF